MTAVRRSVSALAPAPPTIAADPALAAERNRLAELQADLAALQVDYDKTERLLASSPVGADPAGTDRIEGRDVTPMTPPPCSHLAELASRKHVLRKALEIQAERVERALAAASKKVMEDVAPAYKTIVTRMVRAVVDLARLAQDEAVFRENLVKQGALFANHLRPLSLSAFDARDPYSKAVLFIREAIEYGLVDASEVPPDLRARWNLHG